MQQKAKENKEKRELKSEPKLKFELSKQQKEAVKLFYEFDVLFILGDFASGKTATACHTAITAFRKKQFNKIWVTRPILRNNLGTLPNGIDEKMFPYIYPILQNFESAQGKEQTEKMKKDGLIEIIPIDVAKGITFTDSVAIIDEFTDMNYQDFRTILTRLGKGSKIIFCGSKQQIDRQIGRNSCYYDVEVLKDSGLVGWIELTENHRNPILSNIIDFLENNLHN